VLVAQPFRRQLTRTSAPYILIGVAYTALHIAAVLPAAIRLFPDSGTYIKTAQEPLFSGAFLSGERPFVLPLLYKVFGSDSARVAAQTALSIGCWTFLAGVVASCVTRLRPLAFALVLAFSLSVTIVQWDSVILSESVSCSLAAAAVAVWLLLARAERRATVAAVLVVMFLLAFVRSTNAYSALFAIPFVLAWCVRPGRRRLRLILAGGLAVVFAASLVYVGAPAARFAQWEQPLLDDISVRVLPDRTQLAFFRDHGMPVPSALRSLAGDRVGQLFANHAPTTTRPGMQAFKHWVVADGRQTMAEFLLLHPAYLANSTAAKANEILDPRFLAFYRSPGTTPILPGAIAVVLYPPSVAAVLAWLGVVAAVWTVLICRRGANWLCLIPAVLLVVQAPLAAIAWAGDVAELGRHALLIGVLTRLALLILTLLALDVGSLALTRREAGRRLARTTPR
jgi:hypothetical protein